MRKVLKKITVYIIIAALLVGLWYMVWIHGRLFYPRELEGCSVWIYNPEYCEFSDEAMSVDEDIIVEKIFCYCLELNPKKRVAQVNDPELIYGEDAWIAWHDDKDPLPYIALRKDDIKYEISFPQPDVQLADNYISEYKPYVLVQLFERMDPDNAVYWVRTAFTLKKSWYCELSVEAFAYMNEIAETYYKEEKVRRY